MMRRARAGATAALLASVLALAVPAASAQARIPTVTRLVKQFMGLESEVAAALRGSDQASLSRLVAEDFEQREGSRPGEPVSRAEWLQHGAEAEAAFTALSQMAVHEHGPVLVVSFLRSDATGRHGQFVIDVWQHQGEAWKLFTRYVGGATGGVATPAQPVIKKKY
jgi:hypothetical protein